MRKLEIGECEGEKVGKWCWGEDVERRRHRRCRPYLGGRVAVFRYVGLGGWFCVVYQWEATDS